MPINLINNQLLLGFQEWIKEATTTNWANSFQAKIEPLMGRGHSSPVQITFPDHEGKQQPKLLIFIIFFITILSFLRRNKWSFNKGKNRRIVAVKFYLCCFFRRSHLKWTLLWTGWIIMWCVRKCWFNFELTFYHCWRGVLIFFQVLRYDFCPPQMFLF